MAEKETISSRFLKLTGYSGKDVISTNTERRTFVTSNGGKYEINKGGTKVRTLSGPTPPKG